MDMDLVLIFGTSGALFSILHLVPEVGLALRTHRLNDVSWWMLVISILNFGSWLAYGLLLSIYPIIVAATVNLSLSWLLLGLKGHYSRTQTPVRERFVARKKTRKKKKRTSPRHKPRTRKRKVNPA